MQIEKQREEKSRGVESFFAQKKDQAVKALRLHAEDSTPQEAARLSVEELPVPQPAADELLIRVSYSGLGGGDFRRVETASRLARAGLPTVTMGHEFSGIVAGYGSGLNEDFRAQFGVGTPITAEEILWCGACGPCRSAQTNYCENLRVLGFSSDGAHAEYVTVPAKNCWSLQPLVDQLGLDSALRFGSLSGAYGLAYRALFTDERGGAHGWLPGDRILILGAGPVGLAVLDLARAAGAAEVQVLEVDPARRHTARELGAALALAPEDADTLGGKYDRVIDATGAPELIAQLLDGKKVAAGAAISMLAHTGLSAAYQTEALISSGARLVGVQGQAGGVLERVVRMLATGCLQPEKLIRETITLETALQRLLQQKKCEGKILVQHGNA
ncbi:MAG: hypothetical protein EOP11_07350 [Proteobacteria bacterium]|nr:MAG: hypothetical protein EOP11_07350 [Pseudomonadota bacterium]